MPHFSDCCPGADTYVCQVCATIHCGGCEPSEWRTDITGSSSAGNVCPNCIMGYKLAGKRYVDSTRNDARRRIRNG